MAEVVSELFLHHEMRDVALAARVADETISADPLYCPDFMLLAGVETAAQPAAPHSPQLKSREPKTSLKT
jgi:hypothetical protein